MLRKQFNGRCAIVAALSGMLVASTAHADSQPFTYFANITGNAPSLSQFQMTVSDEGVGPNQIGFLFENLPDPGLPSAIANIYFEDGTLVFPQADLDPGSGVEFEQNGSPADPPGINPWGSSHEFRISLEQNTADAIQPGEWLRVIFDLQENPGGGYYGFADVIAAIENGFAKTLGVGHNPALPSLRIAFHVRALANGQSDSYLLSVIPLPAPFGLALAGLAGVVIISRRKRKASVSLD